MSWLGRKCIASIDRREKAALKREREGKLHGWERLAIIAGEVTTITRDQEPGVNAGQQITLLSSPERRQAVYDEFDRLKLTGEVSVTPSRPLFVITITGKRRKRKGGWEITFDVWDGRDRDFFVRRTLPASGPNHLDRKLTKNEIELARFESSYTTNPRQALERVSAPLGDKERRIAMQVRVREAERAKAGRREELTKRDLRSVTSQIREVALGLARSGVDPEPMLVDIQRIVNHNRDQAKAA